ncbi:hypothetical protein ABAC460_09475 [Asticcacaulis sp. AC460]|uniref:hypothetical protein n=1 Tax=Asticcacaulis sp. AC460 TaxID=1282360 RepID=UPI0003C3E3EB|nr:hypothetical protein [Asticcacaulis sp. AC460]ESQ90374.1 hypothetical protein ABAC460_09475 [Asticcacaulis sp. AC460]
MKKIVCAGFAAACLFATVAQAEIDSDLSRHIESRVDSAHTKAAQAQAAFDAGDANRGCRSLLGAARDLDKSIDLGVSLIDRTQGDRSIEENWENEKVLLNMRNRLDAIVDERTVVQQQLELRCQTSA